MGPYGFIGIKMKLIFYIFIFCNILFSQEKDVKKEQKPFDLPEAIIYGNDNLNVKSGFKRSPSNIPKLTIRELDSLNSLEKVRPSVLPVSNLPSIKHESTQENGYILGEFGRFLTSNIDAGYVTEFNEFDLYLKGSFDQSRGHVENAQYSKIRGDLYSDYIAPDKFFIFGGSKTRTNIFFENFNYTNYSVYDYENRNNIDYGIELDVDGNYEGFIFETGAGFNVMRTNGDSLDYSDQSLNGYLKIENPYNKYNLGFNTELDLRNGNGVGNSYGLIEGFASYQNNNLELKFNLGYQLAQYFDGVRNGIKIDAILNGNLSNSLSFKSLISSGLNRNTVSNLHDMNRFLNYDFNIDHSYNNLLIDVFLTYHKDIDFYTSIGLNYGLIERNLNFVNIDSSYFVPIYLDVTKLSVVLDGFYNLNEFSSLNYEIKYNNVVTDTLNNWNTYIPLVESEISYSYKLKNGISGRIGLEYIGKRFADLDNNIELEPFINMNLGVNYRFSKNLSIFAKLENIFNQDIFLYNFYIERGVFGNLGVNYNF